MLSTVSTLLTVFGALSFSASLSRCASSFADQVEPPIAEDGKEMYAADHLLRGDATRLLPVRPRMLVEEARRKFL
jgi:hypothetical protein